MTDFPHIPPFPRRETHAPEKGPSEATPPRPVDAPPNVEQRGAPFSVPPRAEFPEPGSFPHGKTHPDWETPPPPLADSNPFVQGGPPCDGATRSDTARDATRGGLSDVADGRPVRLSPLSDTNGHAALSDAATYHAWGLAQAVVSAAIRDGATPDPTAVRLTRRMAETFAADLAVFLRKQMDYGPGNISAFGVNGVLIRSHDKIERLRTLLDLADRAGASIRAAVKGEAVEDTLGDLTNYGAIGRLVLQGRWPEFEGD